MKRTTHTCNVWRSKFLLLNKRMKAPADGVDCIEGGWYILNSKIRTLTVDSYTIGQHKRSNKRY